MAGTASLRFVMWFECHEDHVCKMVFQGPRPRPQEQAETKRGMSELSLGDQKPNSPRVWRKKRYSSTSKMTAVWNQGGV